MQRPDIRQQLVAAVPGVHQQSLMLTSDAPTSSEGICVGAETLCHNSVQVPGMLQTEMLGWDLMI